MINLTDESGLGNPRATVTTTIAIPVGDLAITAAPPALVTKRNADHLGLSGAELVKVLRAMRADPRFREAVIVRGKSFRAAPPAAILAYLRAAPPVEDDGPDKDDLLRAIGYERAEGRR